MTYALSIFLNQCIVFQIFWKKKCQYYLLANRPEQSDTEFNWDDFAAKNNNELLANVGNMLNRSLKFIYSKFEQVIFVKLSNNKFEF